MNRRHFLGRLGGAGASMFALTRNWSVFADEKGSKPKPNIIFILMDDMGYGDLGCYGNRFIKTPNIDKFASQSCLFTDFYVPMPLCSPTRASCLTGRNPNRYGFKHVINTGMVNPNVQVPEIHHLPVKEPTLPRQLQTVGYKTGTVGKWHLSLDGYKSEPQPRDYGFDYSLTYAGGGSLYQGPAKWKRTDQGIEYIEVGPDEWFPKLYIDESIRFMNACQQENKPFYLNIWPFSPHVREEAAQEYQDMYSDKTEHEKVYYGCVTQMDEQLGRLFKYLDDTNLTDNTIVIFTSDNGPEPAVNVYNHQEARRGSPGPFRGHKHVIYEGGIRVPGIIRWPGLTSPGSMSNVPVIVLDLMPTLCAATGAQLPSDWEYDGSDIRPALANKPIPRKNPLYWQCEYSMQTFVGPDYNSPPLAIRKENWKLMCDMNFENVKLYNLNWDLGEQRSVDKEYPELVASLLEALKAMYVKVNGPYQKKAEYLNPEILKEHEKSK